MYCPIALTANPSTVASTTELDPTMGAPFLLSACPGFQFSVPLFIVFHLEKSCYFLKNKILNSNQIIILNMSASAISLYGVLSAISYTHSHTRVGLLTGSCAFKLTLGQSQAHTKYTNFELESLSLLVLKLDIHNMGKPVSIFSQGATWDKLIIFL